MTTKRKRLETLDMFGVNTWEWCDYWAAGNLTPEHDGNLTIEQMRDDLARGAAVLKMALTLLDSVEANDPEFCRQRERLTGKGVSL